jgi:acetolactate synthase-1/2/3 large subunit
MAKEKKGNGASLSEKGSVTGGELVVRALERKGVKYIFTLSGGHIASIYEHLLNSDIKLIDTRHEQAAVFMAEAYARLTGEVGVALVTAGPGFTNSISSIANARMAGSPIFLISGKIGLNMEGRLDLQDLEQREVIAPIVKWAKTAVDPKRIPELIDIAMRTSLSGNPGPTFLDIPVDVSGAKCDASSVKFFDAPPTVKSAGDPNDIEAAAKIIAESKRPAIIAGSGAAYSNAGQELKDLVESYGIPLFTHALGRGIISEEHPLSFGPGLLIRPGGSGYALTQADAVILLGTRISIFTMFGNIYHKDAKIIQVNIDPIEIGRNKKVDVGIIGDVGLVSKSLKEALKGRIKKDKFTSWTEEIKKQEIFSFDSIKEELESDAIPIHPRRLAKEVDDFMGKDGIVAVDGGDTQIWMNMSRTHYNVRELLDSGLFGCLGCGIPYALTAKLLNPKKRVLLITGDGSLGFNFMEFNTAMRFNLPIVVVVSNDLGWGMIRHSQRLRFNLEKNVACELGDIDYHKLVEAMGGYAERVTKPGEIKGAIERAFNSGKVSLINVMTDPNVISPGSYALAAISASAY